MESPQPFTRPFTRALRHLLHSERAEGVISTGIVVLIMALIGAAMWVTFSDVFDTAGDRVKQEVEQIGSDGG